MKKILVIDDDVAMAFVTRKMIETSGVATEVQVAKDGRAALEILAQNNMRNEKQPDLILLDINMPLMNGFEFLNAFNHLEYGSRDNIRVVILSSSDDPDDINRARGLGIIDYLVKSVSTARLASILI